MRHTFRINVSGRGHVLYSTQDALFLAEHPLDTPSNGIDLNYLAGQKRIDALVNQQMGRWSLCVINLDPNRPPVVAYGCQLPLEDDRGRIGIHFVHAIEADRDMQIGDVVLAVVTLLSNLAVVSERIGGVAKGGQTPKELMTFFVNHFSAEKQKSDNASNAQHNPIKSFTHDCAGAATVAWLAMSVSHTQAPLPWEIYDDFSAQKEVITTISTYARASKNWSLSDYLFQIIHEHTIVELLSALNLRTSNGVPQFSSGQPPVAKWDASTKINHSSDLLLAEGGKESMATERERYSNRDDSAKKQTEPGEVRNSTQLVQGRKAFSTQDNANTEGSVSEGDSPVSVGGKVKKIMSPLLVSYSLISGITLAVFAVVFFALLRYLIRRF